MWHLSKQIINTLWTCNQSYCSKINSNYSILETLLLLYIPKEYVLDIYFK